jgi:nucleoid-associated protein YgaU
MVRYESTRRSVLRKEPEIFSIESYLAPSVEVRKDRRLAAPTRRTPRMKLSAARKLRRLEPAAFAFAAIIAFIGLGCSLFSSLHKSADLASRPFSTVSVTVAPGDTLWSLAQRYEDHALQPADRMDLIRQANPNLGATQTLSPGETLLVPVTSSAVVPEIHLARAMR